MPGWSPGVNRKSGSKLAGVALKSPRRTVGCAMSDNPDPSRFLVLGAYGGIGSSLTRRLRAEGQSVCAGGRDMDKLNALCGETGATPVTVDVTRSDEVAEAISAAEASMGGLDGMALCVGSILLKPAHLTSEEEWAATLAINLTSAFHVVKHGAKALSRTGGSIVLVSTVAARIGLANHEAIAAAKAGVQGLALSAAATYASRGVRVNCVAPGLVNTPLAAKIVSNETALNASRAMHPLGRIGEPEDVASAIAWLLSPEQSWVTGQILGVDGGLSRVRSR